MFDEQVSPTPMPVLVGSRHHTVNLDGSQPKGYQVWNSGSGWVKGICGLT
jgi:hypothetical protein